MKEGTIKSGRPDDASHSLASRCAVSAGKRVLARIVCLRFRPSRSACMGATMVPAPVPGRPMLICRLACNAFDVAHLFFGDRPTRLVRRLFRPGAAGQKASAHTERLARATTGRGAFTWPIACPTLTTRSGFQEPALSAWSGQVGDCCRAEEVVKHLGCFHPHEMGPTTRLAVAFHGTHAWRRY